MNPSVVVNAIGNRKPKPFCLHFNSYGCLEFFYARNRQDEKNTAAGTGMKLSGSIAIAERRNCWGTEGTRREYDARVSDRGIIAWGEQLATLRANRCGCNNFALIRGERVLPIASAANHHDDSNSDR
ncbi:MAG: hypothetical protein HYV18_01565 [Gammaproteobacteria bacterium]|nr:hypothetical protein [Gammaproteobacteria bacterium]